MPKKKGVGSSLSELQEKKKMKGALENALNSIDGKPIDNKKKKKIDEIDEIVNSTVDNTAENKVDNTIDNKSPIVPPSPLPDTELNQTDISFLEDLKWAYAQAGGREKLLEIARTDPEFVKLMVAQIMKVEGKKIDMELKKQGAQGGENNNFFFVMKGLDDTKTKSEISLPIDMKSLEHLLAVDSNAPEDDNNVELEDETQLTNV